MKPSCASCPFRTLETLLQERFASITLVGVSKDRFAINARPVASTASVVLERSSVEQCLRDADDQVRREGR